MKSTQLINGFFSDFEQTQSNINIKYNEKIENNNKKTDDKISQSDLMLYVHREFQKQYIKSSMSNPKTNYRTYWVIVGTIQLMFDDMNEDMNEDNNSVDILFLDVPLDRIESAVKTYLRDNGYPALMRDV